MTHKVFESEKDFRPEAFQRHLKTHKFKQQGWSMTNSAQIFTELLNIMHVEIH